MHEFSMQKAHNYAIFDEIHVNYCLCVATSRFENRFRITNP